MSAGACVAFDGTICVPAPVVIAASSTSVGIGRIPAWPVIIVPPYWKPLKMSVVGATEVNAQKIGSLASVGFVPFGFAPMPMPSAATYITRAGMGP
ncbi:unannotated protein [freshwater metagenome]|uniref:Unannotated protein n=1 Tax=freshwater metagenome TaxID=449393 RepID=A0A6J7C2A5_9ZZZZ